MKKIIILILSLTVLFSFSACSEKKDSVPTNIDKSVVAKTDSSFPSITDAMQYTLYQNIFFNEQGSDYEGKEITKKGTFSVIYDAYSEVTRYYCWGYYDNTKCCDWQWEFVPTDLYSLPSEGSLIEITGKFTKSDEALDGYWFTNAKVSLLQEYKGPSCDLDLTSMSATLERVQVQNMTMFPDKFKDKTVSLYGRVKTDSSIQHPYYDDVWEIGLEPRNNQKLPAIGKYVIVNGTFNGNSISNSTFNETTDY